MSLKYIINKIFDFNNILNIKFLKNVKNTSKSCVKFQKYLLFSLTAVELY